MLFKKTFLPILVASLLLFSCTKKDESGQTPDESTNVEEDKSNIAQAGIDLIAEVDELESATAIQTMIQFGELSDSSSALKSTKSLYVFDVLKNFTLFAQGKNTATEALKALAATDTTSSEAVFYNAKGLYEWNHTTGGWDSSYADAVILKFPSDDSKTTNDAEISITEFDMELQTIDGKSIEMPAGITATLKLDGSTASQYTYDATYANNRPTSITTSFSITPFVWSYSFENTDNTSASVDYSWKNGSKNIMSMGSSATGNWSEDNVDASTHEVMNIDCKYWNIDGSCAEYDTNYLDSVEVDKILKESNAYFQIFDIKFAGYIDVDDFYLEMMNAENQTYDSEKEMIQAHANIANSNIDLYIQYASSGNKIGELEAFPSYYEEENCWTDYDYELNQEVTECGDPYTGYEMDFKMVFPDGSKVNLDAYVTSGMEDLEDELNTFIFDMNAKHGMQMDSVYFE